MQFSVLFVLIFVFYVEAALPTVPPLKLPTLNELRERIEKNIAKIPTLPPLSHHNLSIPPLANRLNRPRLVLKTLTPAPQVTSTTPTTVTTSAPSPVAPPPTPTPAPAPSPTTKHLVLSPPSVPQDTKPHETSIVKPRLGVQDDVKTSPVQKDVKPRVDDEDKSNSSFDYNDFVQLRGFMRDVPRGSRLRHLGRNMLRRTMHSFINNDEHNLEGISPTLDNIHHVVNTVGRLILPNPDHMRLLTDKVPPLIPEYIYQRNNGAPQKSTPLVLNNNPGLFEQPPARNLFENKNDEQESLFGNKNQGLFGRNSIFGNRENRFSFLSPKNTMPGLFGARKEIPSLLGPKKENQNANEELMEQIDMLDNDDLIGQNLKRISSRIGQRIKLLQ